MPTEAYAQSYLIFLIKAISMFISQIKEIL